MNKRIPLALSTLALCGLLVACDDRTPSGTTTPPGSSRTSVPGPVPDTTANAKPDNTANNHPDRSTSDKTPADQSNSQSDIDITASIRRTIMKADNMSTNAQNCKIITDKGAVTLRGPVKSQGEKDAINKIANDTPGVTSVNNLLEIAPPTP
jgi:hyperosmotically inducible periplasmic protein